MPNTPKLPVMKTQTEIWEEEHIRVLSKCSPELLRIVGKHSTLWNYSKLETMEKLANLLDQELSTLKAQVRKEIEELKIGQNVIINQVARGKLKEAHGDNSYNQALTDCLSIPSLKGEE